MCKNVYSIQTKEAVVSLYKSGFTLKQIADFTGVGWGSVQHYVETFKKANPDFKTVKELQRIEQEKRLCELYKSGITARKELARKSGLPYGSIDYILGKWGVSIAAKEARRNAGEIPSELLQPVLDWLMKNAATEAADKMRKFAESLSA